MKRQTQKKIGVKKPSDQYDRHMAAFRDNTRTLLEMRGLTTRQFAELIPCSQGYVNIILNRPDDPLAFQLMCNIADTLGVPVLAMLAPGAFKARSPRKAS